MEGGPRGRCECREVGREVTPAGPPAPYSEVEETERVVSAGRYGTGTVLIPPFSEYLHIGKKQGFRPVVFPDPDPVGSVCFLGLSDPQPDPLGTRTDPGADPAPDPNLFS